MLLLLWPSCALLAHTGQKKLIGLYSASELYRAITAAAGEVSANVVGRGCCVVSATAPYSR
jgi:hypothetical protein